MVIMYLEDYFVFVGSLKKKGKWYLKIFYLVCMWILLKLIYFCFCMIDWWFVVINVGNGFMLIVLEL